MGTVRSRTSLRLGASLWLALGSCRHDDSSSGSTGSDAVSTTSEVDGTASQADTATGSDACEETATCVQGAPAGWEGPGVLAAPGACSGAPTFADLTAIEPRCQCQCDRAPLCLNTLRTHDELGCATANEELPIEGNTCLAAPDADYVSISAAPIDAPSCTPQNVGFVVPAEWGSTMVMCVIEATSCGDPNQACFDPTTTAQGTVCISTPGDVDCPPGSYVDRSVRHLDFSDSRACAGCECSPPAQAECLDAGVVLYAESEADCDAGSPVPSACGPVLSGFMYLSQETASCAAAQPSLPQGEALPTQPVTYCCLP